MRTILRTLTLLTVMAWIAPLNSIHAAEPHAHTHKQTPHGGRLLAKTEPHAELVIAKDRSVTIHFFDEKKEELKQVPATTQSVTLIADAPGKKTKVEFEKKGDSLVGKSKLPEGDGYNIVVQFKQTPDAKPVNLRFKLNMEICAECKQAEYACTCDH